MNSNALKIGGNMKNFDWKNILPSTAKITFSNFCIPDERSTSLERNVAEFILDSGRKIDVEWENGTYTATVFEDYIENSVEQVECGDTGSLVESVRRLAQMYSSSPKARHSRGRFYFDTMSTGMEIRDDFGPVHGRSLSSSEDEAAWVILTIGSHEVPAVASHGFLTQPRMRVLPFAASTSEENSHEFKFARF